MIVDRHGQHHYPAGTPGSKGGEYAPKAGAGWARSTSDRMLPSARRMLEHSPPSTSFPDVAAAFEGTYGRDGQLTVDEVSVHKVGGEDPTGEHSWPAPLGHLAISGRTGTTGDPFDEGGYFRVTLSQTRERGPTDPLRWVAHIDRMHIRGAAQGGGGGRELTDRLIDWFRRSGVDEVTVGPSEVGSYAWGAMGFDFGDREDRRIAWEGAMTMTVQRVRDWFRHQGRSYGMDDSGLTDAQIKKMIGQYKRAASLAMTGGMSYKRLSQYGRRKGQGKNDWWAGKLGLLVGDVGSGRIKL